MFKFNIDRKKFNRYFWIIFAAPFALLVILLLLAGFGVLGEMPDIQDLEDPNIDLASQVISEDGEILGSYYYQDENRTYIDYHELPQHLVDALIATEDIRFYNHSGIDAKGLARMFIKTGLLMQKSSGGGSTITQQLAKLMFHKPPRTKIGRVFQKIKEWIIAVRLEKAYTKEEIITMYFNQYGYNHQATGIKSAAWVYFSTVPDSLNLEQSAMLVGMAKNPSLYDPVRDSSRRELVRTRRNVVFNQMVKYGFLEYEVADSLKKLPIELKFQRISHDQGLATYFREYIKRTLLRSEPKRGEYTNYDTYRQDSTLWADDPLYGWCNKNRKPDGDPYDLYSDGLRIHTAINSLMQQYAEEAMREHLSESLQPDFFKEKENSKRGPFSLDLTNEEVESIMNRAMMSSYRGSRLSDQGLSRTEIREIFNDPVSMRVFSWEGYRDTIMSPWDSIKYYKHFLWSGFMAVDPATGHVKAYVGGIDNSVFQYDNVTMGKRQAGSTFKPFLYILAMQEGYTPCFEVANVTQSFILPGDTVPWEPRSTSKPEDLGKMKTLKWGLANSENNISAWLVNRFKPKPIADIAHNMGIKSYIDPVYSIIYGTSDMSVEEMVTSYATFANKGIHTNPVYVTRIEDKNGNVLAEFHPEQREAIDERTAYLMLNLMQNVVNRGTAIRLRVTYHFEAEMAGKTGTTQNHSDGWFMGITPKLVAGCWVGGEIRSVHFDNMSLGQGANMALPIYALFMEKVYADSTLGITQEDVFEIPPETEALVNCPDDADDELSNERDYNYFEAAEYW